MKPLSFAIIGSGYRAVFWSKVAKRYPEQFELKYMYCRTREKAERITTEYDIPTTSSIEELEAAKPDFVVVAVSKGSICTVTKEWAQKGYPVLCETPAAMTVEELKELWFLTQNGAKIQVAEQYHRYPIMLAGVRAIAEGKLKEPYAVRLSVAHDYHGVSLIRRMLQPQNPEKLRLEYVEGRKYTFPVRETDSRYGAIKDGSIKDRERSILTMQFADGKVAFYDFSGVQYRSFIRSRHVNVQGQDGEWNDTWLRYVDEHFEPVTEKVLPWLNPKYNFLETPQLVQESMEWNGAMEMTPVQEEYAVASMMYDMRAYIEDGVEVYPMAEAVEDAYVFLLMEEAQKHPGEPVYPEAMPWHIV